MSVLGIFSPTLSCSPGFGGALGNPHHPWLGFAAGGYLIHHLWGAEDAAAAWDMELCGIGTVLILLLGFLFLSHCPTHDPSLPPMNSSSTKVFIKTFAIVHTNYISNSSSGQDFDAQKLSNRLKERAFLLHKSVGIVSPAQQSVFPFQSTMD